MLQLSNTDGKHHLGTLIREARTRARLSRAALARLGGLSPGTIKNLERGRDVSPATLRCLLSVRELGLPEDLGASFGADAPHPNAWYAPGFAPLHEFSRMLQVLQGRGGVIDQAALYL